MALGHASRDGDTWGLRLSVSKADSLGAGIPGRWRSTARIQPKGGRRQRAWPPGKQTYEGIRRRNFRPRGTTHTSIPHGQRRHRFEGRDGQGKAITTHRPELGRSSLTLWTLGQTLWGKNLRAVELLVGTWRATVQQTGLSNGTGTRRAGLGENRHGINAVNQASSDRRYKHWWTACKPRRTKHEGSQMNCDANNLNHLRSSKWLKSCA